MQNKIKKFAELIPILEKWKSKGLKVVHCHGVFDLLHPGHIKHFQEARKQGDKLVVTITPDRFVNKGPGRPAFLETFRLESLASLEMVDYVVLNETPDAIFAIEKIKPNVYVKGQEYKNHKDDVTGKISEEASAVEKGGGSIYYTDGEVFSSSALLNQYFSSYSPETKEFIDKFKKSYSSEEILKKIEALADLEVVVIGDAMIDEYQYVDPMGQSGKGIHMAAACLGKELFLGGALIVANHLAQFAKKVTLITSIGKNDPYTSFILGKLHPNVEPNFIYIEDHQILVKKRYVLQDGSMLIKLFETYSFPYKNILDAGKTAEAISLFKKKTEKSNLALVCDFGNGFINVPLIDAIADTDAFLAVNTQTNSGNRGFNVITHYRRADFISLNEPELRLAAHDRSSSLEGVVFDISEIMHATYVSVTRGVKGLLCYQTSEDFFYVPALSTQVVDRLGAGDSYFSLSALCAAKGYPPLLGGFIGSAAAALDVQIVGNRESVGKAPLCKFITRLMK